MINLTPHAITLRLADGTDRTFPPSGTVARVASQSVALPDHDGIPVVATKFGEVSGLPETDEPCLVSAMVLDRTMRPNTFAPDTGPGSVIRDDAGKIVAVRRLVSQRRF